DQGLRGHVTIRALVERGDPGHVRAGHGRTADGVRVAIQPGGGDVDTGRVGLDAGAVVGEGGGVVVLVGRRGGERPVGAAWGRLARVPCFVTGRDGEEDAGVGERGGGGVQVGVLAA